MVEQSSTIRVNYIDFESNSAPMEYVQGWFSTHAGIIVVADNVGQSGKRNARYCFVYRDNLVSDWEVIEFSRFPAHTMPEFGAALNAAEHWLHANCYTEGGTLFFKES